MARAGDLLRTTLNVHEMNGLRLKHHPRYSVRKNVAPILDAITGFESAFDQLKADANLTARGKSEKARELARTALVKLSTFEEGSIAVLATRIAGYERSLEEAGRPAAPSDPSALLVAELRAREIRDQLRSLDQLKRTNIYLRTSDPAVRRAMEDGPVTIETAGRNMPVAVPFIDPDIKAQAIVERGAAAKPEDAETLEDLRAIREQQQTLVNIARKGILDAVPSALEAAPIVVPA